MTAIPANPRIETLLLLGLPASGKSTIRRHLSSAWTNADDAASWLGPTIQLDDFPYVHFMWRVDEIATELGSGPVFFDPNSGCFEDMRDWGALVHLLNEDYAALRHHRPIGDRSAGESLVDRLLTARARVGLAADEMRPGSALRRGVVAELEPEAAEFAAEWSTRRRSVGSTVVIEFSRGGPEEARMPLLPPYGYGWALSLLSEDILSHGVALYVWVTPEDARRRNRKRAEPGAHGSVMVHAVPERVMADLYGSDDMAWLIDHSTRPGTIAVEAHGRTFHVPVARIDNRDEICGREDERSEGGMPNVDARLHGAVRRALADLAPVR